MLIDFSEQSSQCACFAVSVCADNDERALHEALALEPGLAASASVF